MIRHFLRPISRKVRILTCCWGSRLDVALNLCNDCLMRIPRDAVIRDSPRLADQSALIITEDKGESESEKASLSNEGTVELMNLEDTTKLAS